MNIFHDKKLYKFMASVFGVVFVSATIMTSITSGIKVAIFSCWIMFALLVFWLLVSVAVTQKAEEFSSKNGAFAFLHGLVSYYRFHTFLIVLAIVMLVLSVNVWNFLDKKFPAAENTNILESSLPSAIERQSQSNEAIR